MKKTQIKNRVYKAKFDNEFSLLEYTIIADREIIQEIFNALQKIEKKYPKRWEE